MFENYLVGSDIEVFLKDGVTGEIISAEGYIKGEKHAPEKLEREGCATQLDNISLEFNVPPTRNAEEMFDNIQYVLNTVKENLPNGLDIEIAASAELDSKYLQTEQAQTMGCEPSFNAWERRQNERPSLENTPNLRVCGGHIHIGYDNFNMETSEAIIRAMDMFLGVPSVFLDSDKRRKVLYGKAGEFRFTSYGCEYRVLSNYWIRSKELVQFIYDQVQKALDYVAAKGTIDANSEIGKEIQRIINEGDEASAKAFVEKYGILTPSVVTLSI